MGLTNKIALGVGLLAFSAGLSMFISPGLAIQIDEFLILFVAGLAVIQAFIVVQRRRITEIRESKTGDPEIPTTVNVPGDDFDERLDKFYMNLSRFKHADNRTKVRERLKKTAIDVLMRTENCSRNEAIEMLEDGTWTDIEHARGFFTDSGVSTVDMFDIRAILSSEPPFRKRTRITVDAIAEKAGVIEVDRKGQNDQLRSTDGGS